MIPFPDIQAKVQFLQERNGISLSLLREDLIDPQISGNKYRKLKYNLQEFSKGNFSAILSFGGAYSNHISALAAAGKRFGIPTIGLIRGEELANKIQENHTLKFAESCGMKLVFISREQYREKDNPEFLAELKAKYENVFLLPEGGTNSFAVRGCEEILGTHTREFDYISCAVGTGGTITGLVNSAEKNQKILGFPVLKDSDYILNEIQIKTIKECLVWFPNFHFGGYAKGNSQLWDFLNEFKTEFAVNLDAVYTGKMMYGLFHLIDTNYFPKGSKILAVHTGGIQGNEGMYDKMKKSFQK